MISNNVVTGHFEGQYVGIHVGGDGTSAALLPRNIAVVNNTVISGLSNSLRFGREYATLPLEQRPLVVNNTGERFVGMCDRVRSGHNVFGFGDVCTPSDVIGNPHLDATGVPTAASTLLINRGDPAFAPATDFFGFVRTVGLPDIGAIEVGAEPAAAPPPPPKKHAAPRLVSVKAARGLHQVVVRVRTRNATRFTITALRAGRIVAKVQHAGSAGKGVRLRLKAPRRGKLVLRVRAVGPGGAIVRTRDREGAPVTQARLDALVAFALAGVLALWLTPIAARVATRFGLVDHRSSARRLHSEPIPFGGGIAMFIAVAIPVLLLQPVTGGPRARDPARRVRVRRGRPARRPLRDPPGRRSSSASWRRPRSPSPPAPRSTTSRCRWWGHSTSARCSTR